MVNSDLKVSFCHLVPWICLTRVKYCFALVGNRLLSKLLVIVVSTCIVPECESDLLSVSSEGSSVLFAKNRKYGENASLHFKLKQSVLIVPFSTTQAKHHHIGKKAVLP